jgi:hypothetical protein
MVLRHPISDHEDAMIASRKMLATMAMPDRHLDVDRPGDRSAVEWPSLAQEGM